MNKEIRGFVELELNKTDRNFFFDDKREGCWVEIVEVDGGKLILKQTHGNNYDPITIVFIENELVENFEASAQITIPHRLGDTFVGEGLNPIEWDTNKNGNLISSIYEFLLNEMIVRLKVASGKITQIELNLVLE